MISESTPNIVALGMADQNQHLTQVWNAQTDQTLATLSGHSQFVYGMSFLPEGRTLASSDLDLEGDHDSVVIPWVLNRQTSKELDHASVGYNLQFFSDSRRLVASGGKYNHGFVRTNACRRHRRPHDSTWESPVAISIWRSDDVPTPDIVGVFRRRHAARRRLCRRFVGGVGNGWVVPRVVSGVLIDDGAANQPGRPMEICDSHSWRDRTSTIVRTAGNSYPRDTQCNQSPRSTVTA